MTGNQIKEKINEFNARIEELMDPTTFILNEDIVDAMDQIKNLQSICDHEFVDGKCVYCGVEEDMCSECNILQ